MIYLMLMWCGLIGVGFIIGCSILKYLQVDIQKDGDYFITATWSGLIILSIALLGLAFFAPLSPLAGGIVTVGWVGVSLGQKDLRLRLKTWCRNHMSVSAILGFLILAAGVAFFVTRPISWYDTLNYHHRVIRWLSHYGVVQGIGLITDHMGMATTWWSLNAPFNFGLLESRVGTLLGGLGLLMALLHLALLGKRILQKQADYVDWFVLWALLFIVFHFLIWGVVVSPSPDVPVALLFLLLGWSLLKYPGKLPVFLAIGIVAMKPIGIPAIILCGLYYWKSKQWHWKAALFAGSWGLILLLPTFAYGWKTTGCAMFPAHYLCQDSLPWSVGTEFARNTAHTISMATRWAGMVPETTDWWEWFWFWFWQEDGIEAATHSLFFTVMFVWNALLLIGILISRLLGNPTHTGLTRLALLFVAQFAFWIIFGPNNRYGFGFVCLLPAYSLAQFPLLKSGYGLWCRRLPIVPYALTACLVVLGGVVAAGKLYPRTFDRLLVQGLRDGTIQNYRLESPIWIPPKLHPLISSYRIVEGQVIPYLIETQYEDIEVNGVQLRIPVKADSCALARLPCYLKSHVQFANPEIGVSAGFIKKSGP